MVSIIRILFFFSLKLFLNMHLAFRWFTFHVHYNLSKEKNKADVLVHLPLSRVTRITIIVSNKYKLAKS